VTQFRVLNTFRRGVLLVSDASGLVLHLKPGDVITVIQYPPDAVTDTSFGAVERVAKARLVPDDEDPTDNRHSWAKKIVELKP
jgi:hypothetical protein